MKNVSDIINIDPEILGGTPVFRGTRVPIRFLFGNLESINLAEFLDDFDSVPKQKAIDLLELASEVLTSPKFLELYEDFVRREHPEEVEI